ncbi:MULTISPECIES: acyl-CoA dehydrogenase family protein [Haloferax]|uniref:Acyl-CoA dehydrogenase n=1 Tax=Haloferax marinum TaxID=2666143 RepID=A0A6A8GCX8_9EURY|nr:MULTISPECIES: acyl-CoA dehydrogenase family protein [Haloferax]KAB1191138.1 acyl-CoA dehydrogenase [Haloferax sp. CBA1150]MRW98023.1 acyl-CoA dehydrogenase [Haloferax marinum]
MTDTPFEYGAYEEGRHVNYWRLDPALRAEAQRVYPPDEFAWAKSRLDEFGELVGDTIADNADVVDDNGPELHTYDRDGHVQNVVEYHPAQYENDRLTYESGIVADAFDPPAGRKEPLGLVHTLTMQLILSYVDTGFVCPVSMTAGAALVLRNHDTDGELDDYFESLTSRSHESLIEGAMFLTEKQGGSDVGAVETVAEPVETESADGDQSTEPLPADTDGGAVQTRTYELTGEKWFCSNIDAEGTLALARRPGAPDGTAGLSLFLVPNRTRDGELNDQLYRRLKDKLGTISVPTGEVEFDGAEAYLVGEPERGFKYMTTMLNWERITNAVGAVGIVGRALLESKIKAANRDAFGNPVQEHPLMKRDLFEMTVEYEAALAFSMEAGKWLDRYERDHDDDEAYRLMRTLTPIAKYRTARMAVDTASYAMEIQGGNGYVADFVTHRLYRDAQVLPIWEGTSNILALDLLRTFEREAAHERLFPYIDSLLSSVEHPLFDDLVDAVTDELESLKRALATLAEADDEYAQHEAKRLADYVFDVVTASLLLSNARRELDASNDARKAVVAQWFVEQTLGDSRGRSITDGEALPLQYFDAVVRHASLDADAF